LERFQGEVRIARQVSHPNVCRVYDLGEADGIPFISMEYVDGEDLASLLHRIGRLPSDKALEIARKLCAGVAAAHERGVIHRDLKPQNIMLNKRGEVIIMDFGLAAVADQLHGPEARNGTPAYMAPEQLRGDSVTAKSDIYALGLIFYELFTGKRAYEASSVAELIRLEEANRPVSMTTLASDIDPGVEKVILRCLQPDPPQRPPTALMVAAALPGGDPLAAALAAGETPSPEMVAASGKTAGFSLRYAVPCLAFALLSLLAYPFLMQPVSTLALSPMEFPPAVLEAKAREMAAAFGYPEKPRDWASFFDIRADYLLYFRNKTPGRKDWRALFQAEPPVWFIYRQSPFDLASPPDGRIDLDRPAFNVSGMIDLVLDSRGFLRRFQAVAPRLDEESAASPVLPDPGAVFQRAGLDFTKFREATPTYAPVLAFDVRRAWVGQYPGLPDTPITVEIAAWRGKLTSFLALDRDSENRPKPPNWTEPALVRVLDRLYGVGNLHRDSTVAVESEKEPRRPEGRFPFGGGHFPVVRRQLDREPARHSERGHARSSFRKSLRSGRHRRTGMGDLYGAGTVGARALAAFPDHLEPAAGRQCGGSPSRFAHPDGRRAGDDSALVLPVPGILVDGPGWTSG
jgi:serine/threonine-protein kinase